jgi:hypothetical protein
MLCTAGLTHGTIVQEIFDAIGRQHTVKTISAGRNTSVEGKTGSYPVDVYWEFTDGFITYKVVIEAKDWDKTVDKHGLFRFLSLLRDIPGHTSGVLFTRPVYQKEIITLAQDAGIILYEVREPQACQPVISGVSINVDEGWAEKEKHRLGLENETVQIGGDSQSFFIYNDQGNCRDSVVNILNRYAKASVTGGLGKKLIVHEFTEPSYLQTNNEQFPLVKLNNLSFELENQEVAALNGDETLDTVLAEILRFYSRQ